MLNTRIRAHAPEYTIFITSDGTHYILDNASGRTMLTEEGTGLPPLEYVTERGPRQDGETIRDVFLRPRIIQMRIRQNYCSREEFWQGRAGLLDALRPNRVAGIEGVLRRVFADGTTRDIKCAIQQGPNFNPRKLDAWDEWATDEILRFVATQDPTYYDPVLKTTTWINQDCGHFPYTFPIFLLCPLIFPTTFPVIFVHFGGDDATAVSYAGNWKAYPSFDITGPVETLRLVNNTTHETLTLNYSLVSGRTAKINLEYANKYIIENNTGANINLQSYLTPDSDFATWHLEPGVNNIAVSGYGTGAATKVVMNYYERYIGI